AWPRARRPHRLTTRRPPARGGLGSRRSTPMHIARVEVRSTRRPAAKDPIRDALQTLSGGGSVEVELVADDGLVGRSQTHFGRIDGAPETLATLIKTELAPKVAGRDPFLVGQVVEDLKRETEYHGTFGLATFGISAL